MAYTRPPHRFRGRVEKFLLNREDNAEMDFCTGLIHETCVILTSLQGPWLFWGEKKERKADS